MLSQSHIQVKADEREMIARAMRVYRNKHYGEPLEEGDLEEEKPKAAPAKLVVIDTTATYSSKQRNAGTFRSGTTNEKCTEYRRRLAPKLRKLRDDGVTLTKAAETLGVSRVTARKVAKEAGFEFTLMSDDQRNKLGIAASSAKRVERAQAAREALAPTVRKYAAEGKSIREAARLLDCTAVYIARINKEFNITFNRSH